MVAFIAAVVHNYILILWFSGLQDGVSVEKEVGYLVLCNAVPFVSGCVRARAPLLGAHSGSTGTLRR